MKRKKYHPKPRERICRGEAWVPQQTAEQLGNQTAWGTAHNQLFMGVKNLKARKKGLPLKLSSKLDAGASIMFWEMGPLGQIIAQ
ncbi:MAG: hypothetical protein H0A75_01280 [Candidatus Methanofishera endochildressiae]|uniref:Uncharacterized protein n=1 Tax=Candidatus Methanofishera endochildressiae TaxID=2738884 RepID=A0A7Z0SCF4_9GAMM|nr:hypothetical protein [Candidatus Methanofishera endochildressiae]